MIKMNTTPPQPNTLLVPPIDIDKPTVNRKWNFGFLDRKTLESVRASYEALERSGKREFIIMGNNPPKG